MSLSVCPVCGSGISKMTTTKGDVYFKCKENKFENGVQSGCDFMLTPKISANANVAKTKFEDAEIKKLLAGERIADKAGNTFYLDGKNPNVVNGNKFYLKIEYAPTISEDF